MPQLKALWRAQMNVPQLKALWRAQMNMPQLKALWRAQINMPQLNALWRALAKPAGDVRLALGREGQEALRAVSVHVTACAL